MSAPRITAVRGDVTTLQVNAVVNAANNATRGGGRVNGAIHRAGGRAILDACIERFPNSLATGDAGWTTAGDLPARWVIHTLRPNYNAGETDRCLLESCYRRAAPEVARSKCWPHRCATTPTQHMTVASTTSRPVTRDCPRNGTSLTATA